MRTFCQTLIGCGIILITIQFIRTPKNIAAGPDPRDLLVQHPAPPAVQAILQTACYDCHSNTTRYPWYAEIQPLSLWLASHVIDGKKHLNFSTFFDYSPKRADAKLEAMADEVREGEMPLPSYRLVHSAARLTPDQVEALTTWITSVRSRILATAAEHDTP
jgi:hypothetical protein